MQQSEEKKVTYQNTNTYSTINALTNKTKNVWFVCHGIGYLSRYFIRYFNELNPEENYIIAPQASSKYYQSNDYKHVGASWLTKENTILETKNVMNYLNTILKTEKIPENLNFIVLGYSQGVSIISRWIAHFKIKCDTMILYAGSIPNELTQEDFKSFREQNTRVKYVYGNEDPYINEDRIKLELEKAQMLFGNTVDVITFKGGHEVKNDLINNLL